MFKRLRYKKAFEEVFRQHYYRLYMYACHITGNSDDSRDIVGDVFEHLWERFQQLDSKTIPAYLSTAVRNRCIDYLRHLTLNNRYSEEYIAMADLFYSEEAAIVQREAMVKWLLEQLPPQTCDILRLCYLERKTYQEVADLLNISPSTVKKHISKSLAILRELFKDKKDISEIADFDVNSYFNIEP